MSVEDLMGLEVISVSKRAEKLLNAASGIQVVTSEDIRRSGATSIPEALRLADNLDVAQKNSHDWGISARGFNTELANKLLVMIDGRTVYTPLFSGVFWNVQDTFLADLDQIEVVSGPGGTLWGANAVNGVINILSKSAADTQGVLLEAGAGTQLDGFVGGRYGGQLAPGVHFRVYGKYFQRDREEQANGVAAHDGAARGQGGFRLDASGAADSIFTLQGDYYNGHDEILSGGKARESGGNVLARWTRTLSSDSDLSLQLYYDRTHLRLPVAPFVIGATTLAGAGTLEDDLDTYDLDFQHRVRNGVSELIWGFGYRYTHDSVVNAPAISFAPTELTQRLYSAFAQEEVALGRNASFTLGTKVERFDYTGTEWEPGARLQWRPSSGGTLWGAVSRAVRTPSRIDRDLAQPTPPSLTVLRGSPAFDSETVVAFELGWRGQPTPQSTLAVSTFYNDYHRIRSTNTTPVTVLPLYFGNDLQGETWGVELTGDAQPREGWRLHAGYTLLKEDLRIRPGGADFNAALNETSDPQHRFSLRSSLDLPHGIEFDTAWRWVAARPTHSGATPGALPAYSELDVRFSWRPAPAVELALIGQNLLDERHPEYGFVGPTQVEIARRVHGKVTWSF